MYAIGASISVAFVTYGYVLPCIPAHNYVGNQLGADGADPLREALKASRNTSLVTLRHDNTGMHPFRNTTRAHALARAQSDAVCVHCVTHTTIDYKLA